MTKNKKLNKDDWRNATGKIEKPLLRKMYGADQLVAQQNRG